MRVQIYYYFARIDSTKEKRGSVITTSRLSAARIFAARKGLDLKSYLNVYSII